MTITKTIFHVGVNDHKIDLFEGQYDVPNGMSYNSYVIMDEKIAIMDTVDRNFTNEWLENIANVIGKRKPDFLIIQHMEPDHSANILNFMKVYPSTTIVSSDKAFKMMKNFFGTDFSDNRIIVNDGSTLSLGKHNLTFITAPMVHWPEVIMTYDGYDKVLFSADAFGKFGANDVIDTEWVNEARRYYIGIVGKYGVQVQSLLNKVNQPLEFICPLHGPVLNNNLEYYIGLYQTWSKYNIESDGIVIAYTSVYGNTKKAVELLADVLKTKGCSRVVLMDLARTDISEAVANSFRYGKLVLATTTYNGDIFPYMRTFIEHLLERQYQKRMVAFIENGSWAPLAIKVMKGMLENSKEITYANNNVRIMSCLNEENKKQIEDLANELYSNH